MRTLKVLGLLLCYPADLPAADLPAFAAVLAAEDKLPPPILAGVNSLIARLTTEPTLAAQATYVGLFDGSPRRSLNLFEHVHGDAQSRGPALADLVDHYRRHGLDLAGVQLPDYLPVFLEFLSTRPDDEALELLTESAEILALLQNRLRTQGSDYAALFDALLALCGQPENADIARRVAAEPAE